MSLVSWSPLLVALGFLLFRVSVSMVSWSPSLVVLSPSCLSECVSGLFLSVFSILLVSFSLVFSFLLWSVHGVSVF